MIDYSFQTLGNHEFDHGIDGIVPYLKALKVPVVVSNIDDSLEPDIKNLYKSSIVIERNGRKIGIIGVIAANTDVSFGRFNYLYVSYYLRGRDEVNFMIVFKSHHLEMIIFISILKNVYFNIHMLNRCYYL